MDEKISIGNLLLFVFYLLIVQEGQNVCAHEQDCLPMDEGCSGGRGGTFLKTSALTHC